VGADRWDEQVGSVADEAARLLESLRRTTGDAAAAAAAAPGSRPEARATNGPGGPPTGDPVATAAATAASAADSAANSAGGPAHGPEGDAPAHEPFCAWCPLCRSAAVVRTLSPETLSRLADVAGLAATVLADLASTRAAATTEGAPGPVDPTPAPAAGPRPIPVHDADDPQEAPRG
jgi:hypothetical protein